MARGGLAQGLAGRQGKGSGEVAVSGVPGDLHRGGGDLGLGKSSVSGGGAVSGHGQSRGLVLRVLYHVRH